MTIVEPGGLSAVIAEIVAIAKIAETAGIDDDCLMLKGLVWVSEISIMQFVFIGFKIEELDMVFMCYRKLG